MRKRLIIAASAGFLCIAAAAYAAAQFREARPFVFDPAHTHLAQSGWLEGIGCPTGARTFDGTSTGSYTDPACATGDSRDRVNEGLLLVKTGPTPNFASAGAVLRDVRGITLTELGYDIRKPGVSTDPRGSHCGAGAPRFNITTKDGTRFFLGCNSPPATTQTPGNGWLRLRWSGAGLAAFNAQTGVLTPLAGLEVKEISIVFDEGQDTGPDNFGAAVLDNIDVNGQLVGQGAGPRANGGGGDNDDDDNDDGDDDD
jgi:hypothetical protein